jgi:hypothetical protein
MCYNALKTSTIFQLDYTEDNFLHIDYDFLIINYHFTVNCWINKENVELFNKPTFCIVLEVSLKNNNPIHFYPDFFNHYIVLDPTINETFNIHKFGRPLELFTINYDNNNQEHIPIIGSFGFATNGKCWHKIVEAVQNDFDDAIIKFNIPNGTYIPDDMYINNINSIIENCNKIIKKPGIKLYITNDFLNKNELINWCSNNTINCFFYYRDIIGFKSGLSAVTDQAISSGKPMLVTNDPTFRHIHSYINYYPIISVKEAIYKTKNSVMQMKNDWSSDNFLKKFENILLSIYQTNNIK